MCNEDLEFIADNTNAKIEVLSDNTIDIVVENGTIMKVFSLKVTK